MQLNVNVGPKASKQVQEKTIGHQYNVGRGATLRDPKKESPVFQRLKTAVVNGVDDGIKRTA